MSVVGSLVPRSRITVAPANTANTANANAANAANAMGTPAAAADTRTPDELLQRQSVVSVAAKPKPSVSTKPRMSLAQHMNNMPRDVPKSQPSKLLAGVDQHLNQPNVLFNWHRLVLDPMGYFHSVWDILIFIFVLVSATWEPLAVAFIHKEYWFETAIDIVFWLDIVCNFLTAYDTGYAMEKSIRKIAIRYLKGWFLLDVVSTLPYRYINSSSRYVSLLPMLKVIRIARVSRLVNRLTMSINVHSGTIEALKFFLFVMVVAHLLACCFWLSSDFNPEGSVSWRTPHLGKSISQQYVISLYWAVTTMATIGYGDVAPKSMVETVVVIASQLVGLIIFAILITQVNNIYTATQLHKIAHNAHKDNIVGFIKSAAIGNDEKQKLMDKTRELLRFKRTASYHGFKDDDPRFDCLSYALRDEIKQALILPTLLKIKMFGDDEEERASLNALIALFDTDEVKGFLDEVEFKALLEEMGSQVTMKDVRKAMRDLGLSPNGQVSIARFYDWYHLQKYKMPAIQFPSKFLKMLASHLKPLAFSFNDDIVQEGDYGEAFYIVLAGSVNVVKVKAYIEEKEKSKKVISQSKQKQSIILKLGEKASYVGGKANDLIAPTTAENRGYADDEVHHGVFGFDSKELGTAVPETVTPYEVCIGPLYPPEEEEPEPEHTTQRVDAKDRYPVFGLAACLPQMQHRAMKRHTKRWRVKVCLSAKQGSRMVCDICCISRHSFHKLLTITWPEGLKEMTTFSKHYYKEDYQEIEELNPEESNLRNTIDDLQTKLEEALKELEQHDSHDNTTHGDDSEEEEDNLMQDVEKLFTFSQISAQLTDARLRRLDETIRLAAHTPGV